MPGAPETQARRGVDQSLTRAAQYLETQPTAALAEAEAVLRSSPGLPPAELLACQALRRLGRADAALPRLVVLSGAQPGVPAVTWELAQAASETGATEIAVAALERLTRQLPAVAGGWFLLGSQLRKLGRADAAWRADLSGVQASTGDPELLDAAVAMHKGRLDDAAAMLEQRLQRSPEDPPAWRLLGEIAWRRGDMNTALAHVERAVALAPGFDMAREFLIRLLIQANRLREALQHAEMLGHSPVKSPGHDLVKASVLVRLGDQQGARLLYEKILARKPDQPQIWQNLGHVLKTLGQQDAAVDAYREAVARQPTMGEAWWSLANLKTVKLGAGDIVLMEKALKPPQQGGASNADDIFHLHFSLGKAYEDAGDHASAFRNYAEGNRLRRQLVRYDADAFSAEVIATAEVFSGAFLAAVPQGGCETPDPIFIVGLPRSGSTLIEQILSSHSQVEGTMELPDMMMIASRLQARVDSGEFRDFGTMIAALTPADRLRLGEEYLERTRVHRQTGKPHFIDKMPNNWQHVGLIRLILPNAKIIDARRHPMGGCFSAWKQHFARGQVFSYDMAEIGRYYREYAMLMARFDAAAPGVVHRVIYERMVADTEVEIARLLAYVGVPFEPACLNFWQNSRAVRTASSEQVRQPIFTDGVDHWRHFEPWLAPLAESLGALVDCYPAVPALI